MRVTRIKRQSEYAFQFFDARPGFVPERRPSFECVQDDALEQVAQGHVVVVSERLQHFQQSFLEPDAGLDALDNDRMIAGTFHGLGTIIPKYHNLTSGTGAGCANDRQDTRARRDVRL